MRKLRLDVDDLAVEAFETMFPVPGRGTVNGAASRDPCAPPPPPFELDTSNHVCSAAVDCQYSWHCTDPTHEPDAGGGCTFTSCDIYTQCPSGCATYTF